MRRCYFRLGGGGNMWKPEKENPTIFGLRYEGSSYEPYYFGVIGPGFLNQVPTLELQVEP